jgi:hypothetical protein
MPYFYILDVFVLQVHTVGETELNGTRELLC